MIFLLAFTYCNMTVRWGGGSHSNIWRFVRMDNAAIRMQLRLSSTAISNEKESREKKNAGQICNGAQSNDLLTVLSVLARRVCDFFLLPSSSVVVPHRISLGHTCMCVYASKDYGCLHRANCIFAQANDDIIVARTLTISPNFMRIEMVVRRLPRLIFCYIIYCIQWRLDDNLITLEIHKKDIHVWCACPSTEKRSPLLILAWNHSRIIEMPTKRPISIISN